MEGNRISKPNRYPCPAQTNIAKCLPLNIAMLKYSITGNQTDRKLLQKSKADQLLQLNYKQKVETNKNQRTVETV